MPMKKHVSSYLFLVPLLALCVCAGLIARLWLRPPAKSYATGIAKLSPVQVKAQTARLEKIVIPPNGTRLQDVEAVYGRTSLNDPDAIVKGNKEMYHWLHLLPFSRREGISFRAMLLLRVENGAVVQAGI